MHPNKHDSERKKPWERGAYDGYRKEGTKPEGQKAYDAFSLYLKMGGSRSCAKVGQKLRKSSTLIERWSRDWHWQERLAAYEAQAARRAIEATERKRQKEVEEWLDERREYDRQENARAGNLLGLVDDFRTKLSALPILQTEQRDKDGALVVVMPIPPAILTAIASLARTGSEMKRRAIDAALTRLGVKDQPEYQPQVEEKPPEEMTDAELARLVSKIQESVDLEGDTET